MRTLEGVKALRCARAPDELGGGCTAERSSVVGNDGRFRGDDGGLAWPVVSRMIRRRGKPG